MKTRIQFTFSILFTFLLINLYSFAGNEKLQVELINDDAKIDQAHILIVTNRFYDQYDKENIYLLNQHSDKGLIFIKAYYIDSKWLLNIKATFNELVESTNGYENYLVYVHGDSKTFYTAAEQGLQMQNEYETNVIVYSWPSKDPNMNGIKNFKNSREQVEKGSNDFLEFTRILSVWKDNKPDFWVNNNLSMFMHSLGNYHAQQFIETGNFQKIEGVLFDNLILNAAAVNRDNHEVWVEQLSIQDHLYIVFNEKDFNLSGVWFFSDWGRQLGEEPGVNKARNASYIDFTNAVGFPKPFYLSHGYYMGQMPARNENIRNFYYKAFHGEIIEAVRANYTLDQ